MIEAQLRDQDLHYQKVMVRATLEGLQLGLRRSSEDDMEDLSEEAQRELAAMESLKTEISLLEQQHADTVDGVR